MKKIGIACCVFLLFALCSCRKDSIVLGVFRELPKPVEADLSAVWFTDSLHGVATGGTVWEQGFILSTVDGGQSWQTDTLLSKKMEYVMFDAGGQGYVCGLDGLALHRPPGSRHWQVFRVDYCRHRACFFPNDRYGVIVSGEGYRGGIVRNFGPDLFWQMDTVQNFPNELLAVWFSDSTTVHAAGYGWMMRSGDAGRHWQRLEVPGDFYQSLHFPTPETGYACGAQGTILKTTDAGRSWQTIREGGASGKKHRPFRALWFVDASRGWLVGEDSIFWHTDDGGQHWLPVEGVPSGVNFTDVYALTDRGWAVAEAGRIFYFEQR